ncbi:MAG: presenilin family intramembrane aspartyl protease [Candidatus Bathyarchaeia archaeon]
MHLKFGVKILVLTPVLASLIFGVLCAFLLLTSPLEIYAVTPFNEGTGSIGNAIYFVMLVGAGAGLIYFLIKKKNQKLISLITGFALTMAFFIFSLIYLSALFSSFMIYGADVLVLALSILITFMADYAVFRSKSAVCNVVILCLGGALGAFLGISIPTLSTVLILIFLAVYDAFAVYRGPVGKIAHSGLEQLKGLSFSFMDIQMGLGDLTFYSMLSGHMLLNFGLASCVASIVGILFGCLLTFKMVEKKKMFPGLPFPIIFGLAAGFSASLLGL